MLNHSPVTTSQQINTLLLALHTHTAPPEGMLFFKPLVNAKLDYTPESIERLSRLLSQLQGYLIQKNTALDTLISQPQSRLFFLTVAGYLGDYLAKSCDESLVWYSYFEARTEIDKKNREYHTDFVLAHAFENSIVAKIGENMYCQPLRAIQLQLVGQESISEFVAHLQQGIFEQAQINIMAEPNQVCRDYLKKVQTGHLLDTTFGFFEVLTTLKFDYSLSSLAKLDTILANIQQQYQLNADNYSTYIAEPAHQATVYLLGFYIGMTCARLIQQPVVWANYQQIYRTLIHANPNAQLVDSIEHSFVMVVESQGNNVNKTTETRFVTPIGVVTQRLFGIENVEKRAENPTLPLTAMAFYQAFEQNFAHKHHANFQTFPYPTSQTITTIAPLPNLWQIAIQSASRLVNNTLMQIFDGNELVPQLFEIDPISKKGSVQPLANLTKNGGKFSLADYLKTNPKQSPVIVATHDTLINLPTGQCEGIAMDIAVYLEPKLRLRLVLPYRPASHALGFAIYPLIMAKVVLQAVENAQQPELIQGLVGQFYQYATAFISPLHEGSFWQNYYIEPVNSPQKSPLQCHIDAQSAEKITLTLLPVAPLEPIETSVAPKAVTQKAIEPIIKPILEPVAEPIIKSALAEITVENPTLPNLINQPAYPNQPAQATQSATTPVVNQFYNQNSAPLVKPDLSKSDVSQPVTVTPTPNSDKTPISPELLAQLRQDQQRLHSQLSTSDGEKDRKIIMLVVSMGMLVLFLLFKAWLKK